MVPKSLVRMRNGHVDSLNDTGTLSIDMGGISAIGKLSHATQLIVASHDVHRLLKKMSFCLQVLRMTLTVNASGRSSTPTARLLPLVMGQFHKCCV